MDHQDESDKNISDNEERDSHSSVKSVPPLDEIAAATSPDGRFLKINKKIGDGSFKTVFQGFDTELGISVAWCELKERSITKEVRDRFREEAEMLKKLDHPNIVRYYDFFELPQIKNDSKYILITELLTSGTLKVYRKRFSSISDKLLKNWCRQILKGLLFLHSQIPPIIHRDLKCDNIFMNGAGGCLKLGDLGLATTKEYEFAKSVIGTPEFMAPEMYDECYDESVDVYAFGMCMLEIITNTYPYSECKSAMQVYNRVSRGLKPNVLEEVKNSVVHDIINRCIEPLKENRFTIIELLNHSFFKEEETKPNIDNISYPPLVTYNFSRVSSVGDSNFVKIMLNFVQADKIDDQREERLVEFKFFPNVDRSADIIHEIVEANAIPAGFSSEILIAFNKFLHDENLQIFQGADSLLESNDAVSQSQNILNLPDSLGRRIIKISINNSTLQEFYADQSDRFGHSNSVRKNSTPVLDDSSRPPLSDDEDVVSQSSFNTLEPKFLILYLKQILDENLVECGLESPNNTKLTFKFSIKDDLAPDIAQKLINSNFLEEGYRNNFIKNLKLITETSDQLISKKFVGKVEQNCLIFLPDIDTQFVTENHQNPSVISNNSGITQRIDLSAMKLVAGENDEIVQINNEDNPSEKTKQSKLLSRISTDLISEKLEDQHAESKADTFDSGDNKLPEIRVNDNEVFDHVKESEKHDSKTITQCIEPSKSLVQTIIKVEDLENDVDIKSINQRLNSIPDDLKKINFLIDKLSEFLEKADLYSEFPFDDDKIKKMFKSLIQYHNFFKLNKHSSLLKNPLDILDKNFEYSFDDIFKKHYDEFYGLRNAQFSDLDRFVKKIENLNLKKNVEHKSDPVISNINQFAEGSKIKSSENVYRMESLAENNPVDDSQSVELLNDELFRWSLQQVEGLTHKVETNTEIEHKPSLNELRAAQLKGISSVPSVNTSSQSYPSSNVNTIKNLPIPSSSSPPYIFSPAKMKDPFIEQP